MSEDTTTEERRLPSGATNAHLPVPALVVRWLDEASHLAGAVVLSSTEAEVLGRGEGEGEPRARMVRQVPGENLALGPLRAPWLSRRQLRIQRLGDDRLQVENLGRSPLYVRGEPTRQAVLRPGDGLLVGEPDRGPFLLASLALRPPVLPSSSSWPLPVHPLGAPDGVGLVGDGATLWALRDRLAFLARQSGHVLVLGPSGAGKERVAQALHALSPRAKHPMVARNAATIPASLMDVELFGHVHNFPNPGMRERPGLIGEADRSTLFLDEIGELPHELQAHLLRVLDSGEYQRLGDPRPRRVDLRVIAATNRDPATLKPDLVARFRHTLAVPPLAARPEDLPLLVRHILRLAAREEPLIAKRFFDGDEPRLGHALLAGLLAHDLPMQVRSLEALLWDAITHAIGAPAPHAGPEHLGPGPALSASAPAQDDAADRLSPVALQAALDRNLGNIERSARELGLKNRYVLRRLIAKHGLRVRGA